MSASTARAGSRASASSSPRAAAPPSTSPAINDRAMFHADNCYYLPAVEIVSHRLKTHTVSNTAFRGFGGPQGMMAIERVMDAIAAHLGLDPLEVRQANLYGPGRDVTPYHMTVEDNVAPELIAELAESAGYAARRAAVAAFNASHHDPQEGPRADPGQVRDQLHHHPSQPGRRAGAGLCRRLDPPEPWRHRDGPGADDQGRPGGGRRLRRADREREGQRDAHRQGAQHLGHRRLLGLGPQRHGREERRRDDQARGLDAFAATRQPRGSGTAAGPSPSSAAAPISPASRSPRPASTPRRRSTTTAPAIAAAPSSISLMARRSARS